MLEDLMGRLPGNVTTRVLACKVVPTPDFLHREWPDVGKTVLTIRALRYVRYRNRRDAPYQLQTRYFPGALTDRLRRDVLERAPLLSVFDRIGVRIERTEYTAGAVAADPSAANQLEVSLGAPLLLLRGILVDGSGQTQAIKESLWRPDLFQARMRLERGSQEQDGWRFKATRS
jgi:GntR family transcriptional regulator